MDENITNEVETTETAELEDLDAAFDEEWGDEVADDDDFDLSHDEAEESPDAQPEEAEAVEETDSEPESADDSPAESGADGAESGEGDGQNQSFTIKVNGEDKQITLAEMTELAQKGMDYDRIKQERDTFKQDAPTIQKYKGYEAFLAELASSSGMGIDALIENTRARMLINEAKDRGEELSEEEAVRQVREKAKAEEPKPAETEKPAEPEPPRETEEEKRNKAFAAFVSEYPNVDPKTIPQEVWSEFGKTTDLVGSYRKYEIKQLRSENEQLKQNQKNKERSTGSRRSAGATTPKDAFDEGWDSDF